MGSHIVPMKQTLRFVSIGAGNVATHLVKSLCNKGCLLIQVYSRTAQSAQTLATGWNAEYTASPEKIKTDADFYLVSLSDQALTGFLQEFSILDKLIFHTAGSHGLEVFGDRFKDCAVLYPLQTFNKNVELDLSQVPILIEAKNEGSLREIQFLAEKISKRVIITDSEARRWIHLAAVFACNFTNHMVALSSELLQNHNLDPGLLNPLIAETFRKFTAMGPAEAQTGPAYRNDSVTMEKHLKMLESQTLLQKIYTFTSRSIQDMRTSGNKRR